MRTLSGVCVLIALAAPAQGQAVTLAELNGATIETTIMYQTEARWNGQPVSTQSSHHRTVVLGPGNAGRTDWSMTITGPRGTRSSSPQSYSFTLGQPQQTQSLGGGHSLWTFANGTLTYLQTHRVGGFKSSIAFTRRAGGVACAVRAPLMREVGMGNNRRESVFGGDFEIIGSRQMSSSCRVATR